MLSSCTLRKVCICYPDTSLGPSYFRLGPAMKLSKPQHSESKPRVSSIINTSFYRAFGWSNLGLRGTTKQLCELRGCSRCLQVCYTRRMDRSSAHLEYSLWSRKMFQGLCTPSCSQMVECYDLLLRIWWRRYSMPVAQSLSLPEHRRKSRGDKVKRRIKSRSAPPKTY